MSIFSTILEKLGLHKQAATTSTAPAPAKTAAPAAPAPVKPTVASAPPAQAVKPATPAAPAMKAPMPAAPAAMPPSMPAAMVPPKPAPMAEVDVVAKLDAMAAKNPAKLNWKNSIVDLLKLLEIDSSYEARKELAVELGCPAFEMADSARMNVWLHKTVMKKIAENGGNIPMELLT